MGGDDELFIRHSPGHLIHAFTRSTEEVAVYWHVRGLLTHIFKQWTNSAATCRLRIILLTVGLVKRWTLLTNVGWLFLY